MTPTEQQAEQIIDGLPINFTPYELSVLVPAIARLEADLRAALDIAEASARQCAKLRAACEQALAIAEWREAGDFDTVMRLMRAALAPEEPPA